MNGYYNGPYSQDDLQQLSLADRDGNAATQRSPDGMGGGGGPMGGQSLDDIVNQNSKEMRRRSFPVQYSNNGSIGEGEVRGTSMMNFGGATPNSPLDAFHFSPQTGQSVNMLNQRSGSGGNSLNQSPVLGGLPLQTGFSNSNAYSNMGAPGSSYASPMHSTTSNNISLGGHYNSSGLSMALDMTDTMGGLMSEDMNSMNIFGQQQSFSPMMQSPMHVDFNPTMSGPSTNFGTSGMDMDNTNSHTVTPEMRTSTTPRTNSQEQATKSGSNSRRPSASTQTPTSELQNASYGPETPQQPSQPVQCEPSNSERKPSATKNQMLVSGQQMDVPWEVPVDGFPSTMFSRPHMSTSFTNAYSTTGFDMLSVLMRVAARPNPEINIGSVDMSCAFVVCDADMDDFPIVYCSENFERLTGYTKHMILGRNCRFLQSPDGKVEPGIKRKYVDDDSVLYLKNMIATRREAQISLINYRRGGQPFMNLLTMIPIPWEEGGPIKYFVGFQVDLVEQPNSVTNKNPDGSFTINYQRSMGLPSYVLNTPESNNSMRDSGQTIPRDDVSTVLSTIGTGESELSKRIFDKVLLENTDDVVHVLSLKGLFLYLSPASRKVLEYDASELMGTALSSVCHPSDIVPVTRELKETSNGASVNVVYRIRRKNSGYMWFESHGSLHTEQGKGRKCIILVGRERPVYTVSKSGIQSSGGIGDNELWSKMSTSGMFLFVSSNVRSLLDRTPDEL
ncbi:hypothetical protein LTS18_008269, partial [Coniosporium uncinatum]